MASQLPARLWQRLGELRLAPESELLRELAADPANSLSASEAPAVRETARGLLRGMRRHARHNWMEGFLQEYGLSTAEGLALMGLAESYLRVADPQTADALVRDKLGGGDWASHLDIASPLAVNASTLGLAVARSVVEQRGLGAALKALGGRLGDAAIRRALGAAMRMLGNRFVLGRTIEEALKRAGGSALARSYCYSFDMLGEGARCPEDAQRYADAYARAIEAVGNSAGGSSDPEALLAPRIWRAQAVSVKLSALHGRYEPLQEARAVPLLAERLAGLARLAKDAGIGLTMDAEECDRLAMSLRILELVRADPLLRGWEGLGLAVQAYQKRAPAVLDLVEALGEKHGHRIQVRLVKGAYWDTEIKLAQERGLRGFPVFTRKAGTDLCYLACARRILRSKWLAPAFATHNAMSAATLMHWSQGRDDVEFQCLHGMGTGLYDGLAGKGEVRVRVYAPVGGHRELLAYLIRRLLENGANSSFVHQISQDDLDEAQALQEPWQALEACNFAPHPGIAAPLRLFGARRENSIGLDLSEPQVVAGVLAAGHRAWAEQTPPPPPAQLEQALARAHACRDWGGKGFTERALVLERAAQGLEEHREGLACLLMLEARKTLADALDEVREAVDFCRYYADCARDLDARRPLPGPVGERNELRFAPRGPFACISPWNFPLAIFVGQVAAALVAGNPVLAKPAPQTPRVAARAVEILHGAGAPGDALQLLPGGGETGAALVADARVRGVAFTGSTATAKAIARILTQDDARPLVPLVAETGGVNAMVVDSTALPEQVVDAALHSAFGSAGQRCSALRLLCLQEEIAPEVERMMAGAMAELRLGDPMRPDTDIGPLIDAAARERVMAHIDRHRDRVLAQAPLPGEGSNKGPGEGPGDLPPGNFVAPTLIALDGVADLRQEVFGPVLHLVRWKAGGLEELLAQIDALGFGLTMGLQSRIAEVLRTAEATSRVGNIYLNRGMTGAVVGSQPFGGEGLSGTGPKAGGPHYLLRFVTERVTSQDTAAAGGNATLLSLDDGA